MQDDPRNSAGLGAVSDMLVEVDQTSENSVSVVRSQLAGARERIDELEAKVKKLQVDRDNWERQAGAVERMLLRAKGQQSDMFRGELVVNVLAMLAFFGLVALVLMFR